ARGIARVKVRRAAAPAARGAVTVSSGAAARNGARAIRTAAPRGGASGSRELLSSGGRGRSSGRSRHPPAAALQEQALPRAPHELGGVFLIAVHARKR